MQNVRSGSADGRRGRAGRADVGAPPPAAALTDFAAHVETLAASSLRDPQFGVERLAETLGITDRHLRRRLVAQTGETPRSLIRRLRVRQAEAILGDGTPGLEAVSRAVGYTDAGSLRRAFLAVTGRTVAPRASPHDA